MTAERFYQKFKRDVLSPLEADHWMLDAGDVRRWLELAVETDDVVNYPDGVERLDPAQLAWGRSGRADNGPGRVKGGMGEPVASSAPFCNPPRQAEHSRLSRRYGFSRASGCRMDPG